MTALRPVSFKFAL